MIAARLRASHVALGGAVLTIVSVGAIQAYRILKSRKPARPFWTNIVVAVLAS